MSLQNLSLPLLLTGLVALAAILFVLQRLRVRYREHTVVTTLFWKQAIEEARARVLVRRFKHPLAYLFVLLIGALMWLGFADPELGDASGPDHVILVDGSAGMGRGSRLAATLDLVKSHVNDLPRNRRRVIYCGGRSRPVLREGEDSLLLDARLPFPEAEVTPATVDATLRTLSTQRDTVFVVAGDAPISATTRELLRPRGEIVRLAPPRPATSDAPINRGITSLGIGRAARGTASSEDWENVEVLCEVEEASPSSADSLGVSIGGRAVTLRVSQSRSGNRTRFLLQSVPATGEILTVELRASETSGPDELAVDDRAAIRLPNRKRIRVALAPSLEASVGPVLRADPAIFLAMVDPDVVVQQRGDATALDAPTLEFVPIDTQEEAILLFHPADEESQDVLLESFEQLGLSEVDAMDVAQASGRPIAVGAAPSPPARASHRGIGVWAPLLSEQFNFVQSRSFPLFIAQSVRWLARVQPEPTHVAAGHPVVGLRGPFLDDAGTRLDPLGADFVPPVAGTFRDESEGMVVAALTDPASTTPEPGVELADLTEVQTGRGFDVSLWLAGLILLLLCAEWILLGTGRMP